MRKPVVYLAHPVTGDPRGNAMRAVAWIKWLTVKDPDVIYVAPWVAEVLAFAEDAVDPAFYDRVLTDDEDVVLRLDGLLMVGGRVSSGMARERTAARVTGRAVLDWSNYTTPSDVPHGLIPSRPRSVVGSQWFEHARKYAQFI